MDDRLIDVRRFWDRLAGADPMWAILSESQRTGGQWRLQEFMKNGEREIALLFHRLNGLHLSVDRAAAVDFGCGIGRNTQALARRFQSVIGLDISAVMIDLARRINRYPGVEYICTAEGLNAAIAAGTLDLVYCNIVLQHVPPEFSRQYLVDFLRWLRPGGLLVFQLPSHLNIGASEIRAMADDAYRAALSYVVSPNREMRPGESATVVLRLRNTSGSRWTQPAHGSIRVGNHWLDAAGSRLLVQDDGRAVLPQIVAANEEHTVELRITAPATAGDYVCEVDVVHEGVTWFDGRGSTTLRAPVRVTDQAADAGDGMPSASPRAELMIDELDVPDYESFDVARNGTVGANAHMAGGNAAASTSTEESAFLMCGIPKADVLDLLTRSGGAVVHVDEDPRALPEWIGYRYFVRKS